MSKTFTSRLQFASDSETRMMYSPSGRKVRSAKFNWPWDWNIPVVEERQDVSRVPARFPLVVGTAYLAIQLFTMALNPSPRPFLESDANCGIPTGGKVLFVMVELFALINHVLGRVLP